VERELVPILQEAEWSPEPVWTCAKNLFPTGTRTPDRQAHSDRAIPAHNQSVPKTALK